MHGDLISGLQSLAPIAASLMVLAALSLLWRANRSIWLIVAIAGEFVGLVFSVLIHIAPGAMQSMPLIFALWTLAALVFAGGLLAYAIETTQRR